MAQPACCTISYPHDPMCCDLSPTAPVVAAGLVSGQVQLHRWTCGERQQDQPLSVTCDVQWSLPVHGQDQSCRAVRWLSDGAAVVSGGLDTHIVATAAETGKQMWRLESAHEAGISMLYCVPAGSGHAPLVVSGDESGGLKVWDIRSRKQVMSYRKHTDYISSATLQHRDHNLVVTSGDGTLSVHDLRTCKYRARSEVDADDELLSVAVLKNGQKVVAGSGSGVLFIYSWGYFNDCSDRFPGHPESVDALVVWDDSTLLTGSSDGMIRAVNILPNKLLGVVGAHEELPVESLALSYDRSLLASTSHDDTVRLWDLSILSDDSDGDDGGEGDGSESGDQEEGVEASGDDEQGESDGSEGDGGDSDAEASESESEGEGGSDSEGGSGDEQAAARTGGKQQVKRPGKQGVGTSSDGGAQDGSDSDGDSSSSEEEEEKEEEEGPVEAAAGRKLGARGAAAAGQSSQSPSLPTGAGGAKRAKLSATLGGKTGAGGSTGAAGGGSDSSDGDGEDSDDDDDDGGRKGGKRKRERTRWTKEKNKKQTGNFFADLF